MDFCLFLLFPPQLQLTSCLNNAMESLQFFFVEIRGSSMVLIFKVIGVLIGMLNENFPKILDNLCENLVPCCLTTPQLHLLPQGSSKNFRGPFCDFVHPRNSTLCSAISKWIYLVLETSKWDLKKVWTKLEKYPSLFSSQWHARILTILISPNFN